MVSPARLAANRLNARRSTGPRTPDGKRRSALNALRHGLYARVALLPALGETAADWAAHRVAIRHALTPSGAAEEAVADRVAWVLWRQRRLALVSTGADPADLPPDPDAVTGGGVDSTVRPHPGAPPAARLAHARARLSALGAGLASLGRAAAALAGSDRGELGLADALAATNAAGGLLDWGILARPDPWVTVLRDLGVAVDHRGAVDWTPDLLRRAVARAGGRDGRDPVVFLTDVRAAVERAAADRRAAISSWQATEAELAGELQATRAAAAGASLVGDDRAERVARAEAHLSRELDRALGQLARLRTLRPGYGGENGFAPGPGGTPGGPSGFAPRPDGSEG
jgi:hypothetical protein